MTEGQAQPPPPVAGRDRLTECLRGTTAAWAFRVVPEPARRRHLPGHMGDRGGTGRRCTGTRSSRRDNVRGPPRWPACATVCVCVAASGSHCLYQRHWPAESPAGSGPHGCGPGPANGCRRFTALLRLHRLPVTPPVGPRSHPQPSRTRPGPGRRRRRVPGLTPPAASGAGSAPGGGGVSATRRPCAPPAPHRHAEGLPGRAACVRRLLANGFTGQDGRPLPPGRAAC